MRRLEPVFSIEISGTPRESSRVERPQQATSDIGPASGYLQLCWTAVPEEMVKASGHAFIPLGLGRRDAAQVRDKLSPSRVLAVGVEHEHVAWCSGSDDLWPLLDEPQVE
ncbi:MAG: hypothetical protein WAU69_13905 [Solirubrobacteraceae bacterium]